MTVPTPPSPDLVRAVLQRCLASPGFAGSEQLSRFLRFVVTEALEGRGHRLKEQSVGTGAFAKPAGYDPTVDSSVRVHARQLRFKLTEYFAGPGRHEPLIIDLPKGSYVPTFVLRELAPATIVKAARSSNRWRWIGAGSLTMALALVVWRVLSLRPAPAPPESIRAVAVLPFLNLTGSPDREYLGDGLTEEITTTLANVPGLAVVARTSAFQFKNKAHDIRDIGRRLGVGAVLEGSVRASGDSLRITAQLARTSDGLHLWAATYDRDSKDLVAVQRTIAAQVVTALRTTLSALPELEHPPGATSDPEAHILYLRARHFWNKRTREAMLRAIDLYGQAIARDSAFALAYAGLAAVHATMLVNNMAAPDSAGRVATVAAERALRINPGLGEAHATLGLLKGFAGWDWQAADQEFADALRLSPNYAVGRFWYANTLTARGRVAEALEQLRQAAKVDPLSAPIAHGIGETLLYARRWDESIAQANALLEMDASYRFAYNLIARAHLGANRLDQAAEALRLAGDSLGLSVLRGRSGNRAKAAAIRALADPSLPGYPALSAYGFAFLGEVDSAFRFLDRAVAVRQPEMMSILVEPQLDPIRGDPRFRILLDKVGLRRGGAAPNP